VKRVGPAAWRGGALAPAGKHQAALTFFRPFLCQRQKRAMNIKLMLNVDKQAIGFFVFEYRNDKYRISNIEYRNLK
jgi:hypothetical protein